MVLRHHQFPPNEIGEIFNHLLPKIKRRKILTFFILLFILTYFSLPGLKIPIIEHSGFRITSLMEQRALENNLFFFPKQSWTDIDDVNPNTLRAIISMEDGSFFLHKGIDWKELKTSLRVNRIRGRAARGGSTISMQTAKNLFLTTDKSLLRKAKEFLITFRMEKEVSKKEILENYINAIEWGEGIFGIKKAAEVYFGKSPSELNLNESSRLAAVIPSPLKYRPNQNSRYVIRRASIIRGRLHDVVLFPEPKRNKKK